MLTGKSQYLAQSGSSISKTAGGNTWNAGAASRLQITGMNMGISFKPTRTDKYYMIGLNKASTDTSFSYTDIDFAMYVHRKAELHVYENGKSRGKKGSNRSENSSKAKGKLRGKHSGKKPSYVQVRKSLKQKELSRGFVTAETPKYSEAEKSRLLAITECFRCKKMGQMPRNCLNAPAESKGSALGFSQEFFFMDIHREGPGANYVVVEGASPNMSASVGGDADSAHVFAPEESDSDSELEIADVAAPLLPLPERAPDGTTETGDMVEYKTAFQFAGFHYAVAQMRFKIQYKSIGRELCVFAKYLNQ